MGMNSRRVGCNMLPCSGLKRGSAMCLTVACLMYMLLHLFIVAFIQCFN